MPQIKQPATELQVLNIGKGSFNIVYAYTHYGSIPTYAMCFNSNCYAVKAFKASSSYLLDR